MAANIYHTETKHVSRKLLLEFAGGLQSSGLSLGEAFKKYDSNGNMILDRNEFSRMVHDFCPHATANDVQQLMNAADEDSNGSIDFKEFRCTFGRILAKVGANTCEIPQTSPSPLSPTSTNADIYFSTVSYSPAATSKSGVCLCSSGLCTMNSGLCASSSPIVHDSVIDPDEYYHTETSKVPRTLLIHFAGSLQQRGLSLAEAFHKFDSNGNMILDRGEFSAMVHSICPHASANDVNQLLIAADHDHNGSIDFNEFRSTFGPILAKFGSSIRDIPQSIPPQTPVSSTAGLITPTKSSGVAPQPELAKSRKFCAPCGLGPFSWLCGKPTDMPAPPKAPQLLSVPVSRPTYAGDVPDSFNSIRHPMDV